MPSDNFSNKADITTLLTTKPNEVIVASALIRTQDQNNFIIVLVHEFTEENRRCLARVIDLNNNIMTETLIDKMYTHIAYSDNSIFMAGGTTLAQYMFTQELKIVCISRIDNVGTNIVNLKANCFAIVGDENCGMMIYRVNEKFRFECIMKEYMHRSITSLHCIGAINQEGKFSIVTGDRAGNIIFYNVKNENKLSLNMIFSFNVGAPVTGCNSFETRGLPFLLYTTITGAIGSFVKCSEFSDSPGRSDDLYLLSAIIMKVIDVLTCFTKVDILESMYQMFPMTSVLDLDIASLYSRLSNKKRNFIFNELKKDKRMESIPDDFITADVMFKDMITQMKLFFIR